jgi:hypothetical protein
MKSSEEIDQEIEEQKKRLAELESQKSELKRQDSETLVKNVKYHIFEWCTASANLLEIFTNTIVDDNNMEAKLNKELEDEFNKASRFYIELEDILSKSIGSSHIAMARPHRNKKRRSEFTESEHWWKTWQDYKNSD